MLHKAPYAAIALSLLGLAASFAGALAPGWFAPHAEQVFHGGGIVAVGGLITVALLRGKARDEAGRRIG